MVVYPGDVFVVRLSLLIARWYTYLSLQHSELVFMDKYSDRLKYDLSPTVKYLVLITWKSILFRVAEILK